MKNDTLSRLILLFEKYSSDNVGKPNANTQMCLFWATTNPPDILEGTKQLEKIEAEFDIDIDESEAVEMYDMNLLEASEYIQILASSQFASS